MKNPTVLYIASILFFAAGLAHFALGQVSDREALDRLSQVCQQGAGDEAGPELWDEEVDRCLSPICWREVPGLPHPAAVLRDQVMRPADSASTMKQIEDRGLAQGARVLDLGTGAGLYALQVLQLGADQVVATDILPMAIANTVYNAKLMGWSERIDARLVSLEDPGAYSVLHSHERFDLILCNPPGDDRPVARMRDFQDNDPGFQFILSILDGLPQHLTTDGRLLLTYSNPTGLRVLQDRVKELGYGATFHIGGGPADFLAHKVGRDETDYERGGDSPVLEIVLGAQASP